MEAYYYFDGQRPVGPHNLREMQELYALSAIKADTPVTRVGHDGWATLKVFCDLEAPECQPLELGDDYYSQFYVPPPADEISPAALADEAQVEQPPVNAEAQEEIAQILPTEEERESQLEEEEEVKRQRVTRHQLLRQLRSQLDQLWECQRESIIARIRFEPLDKSYEATRRKNREIYRAIEESAIEYWRRSGLLTYWIRELTWREHDFTYRLRGKNEAEKYAGLQAWLDETRLADLAGCYCFKNGREYIYVGQAGCLHDRIKQHEKKTYFTYANAVRVIIPKNKRQMNQLERLLILAHQPSDNGNRGVAGRTPVDDCLEFISGEIKELITDF
jgi:hypothetical protein